MSRPSAERRLQRLIVMVPWVMNADGPSVEEVCERFDMTENELASDLEMLFLCGLYPFTPDTLIEADIMGGRVWIRSADAFTAPPRFTGEEAVALFAAASTVAALPGNEDNTVLQHALGKLAVALGLDDDDIVDITLAPTVTSQLDEVRRAIRDHLELELDYYSYGKDSWKRRTFQPHRVFNSEGQWYVIGLDRAIEETRNFRLDRMRNVVVTDTHFDPPSKLPEPRTYEPRPDDPAVVLELEPAGRWVLEQYPTEASDVRVDGTATVTLRISEQAWLERLLLRLGSHARVVSGDQVGAQAAARVLSRYKKSVERTL
jgi:proteasome accessory factor C